ncbi:MAG: lipid-A-disaccharide synthase [Victivallales bacterium]|nr:lipid-A-disaccharide synthase [Victivallales bacterium]
MSRTIWIISGETSGDMYGAALAKELWERQPGLTIKGMGGAAMRKAGVEIMVDSTELGVVGIVEVLKSIFFFIRLLKDMARRAAEERPDAVILIDYPGFNLRLAQRLHKAGIPVIYYISPQVWAWKKGRIKTIAKCVRRMLCIFPFEPAVYDGTGLDVKFIGHPLLDILAPLRKSDIQRDEKLVLLLPGSRSNELKALLKTFVQTALLLKEKHQELHFVIPLPREKTRKLAERLLEECNLNEEQIKCFQISVGDTRQQMKKAIAGIAASGTVTVEAAMLGLPLVVSYKVSWLTYQVAKALVKLPSITIANLVTGQTVYEERLQYDAVPDKLASALEDILPGGARRQTCLEGIEKCVKMLGEDTKASARAAEAVIELLEGRAGDL